MRTSLEKLLGIVWQDKQSMNADTTGEENKLGRAGKKGQGLNSKSRENRKDRAPDTHVY